MVKKIINVGETDNDGTGDKLRDAFVKTNENFTELYTDVENLPQDNIQTDVTQAGGGSAITNMVLITRAAHAALSTPDPATIYLFED